MPILQHLGKDPYGIFALVITPTRELAVQISQQITALGAPLGVRVALIIGGANVVQQGLDLEKRPHFVVATPGRMRHHLMSGSPPNLERAKYLVLDEADRLVSSGFQAELDVIINSMSENRSTLLFSATLTESLERVSTTAVRNTIKFDLTSSQKMPAHLIQEFLLMPTKIKTAFLYGALSKLGLDEAFPKEREGRKPRKSNLKSSVDETRQSKSSVIIFTETCRRCQEIWMILSEMGVDCVCLHSLEDQSERLSSLSKFKNQLTSILVATDVASRGLDIPQVDVVIHYDLPRITEDYIHRSGRTARAGRSGRTISFVTEADIKLLKMIESHANVQLQQSQLLSDADVAPLLNTVSKASHTVRLKLAEMNFEEKEERRRKRRRKD